MRKEGRGEKAPQEGRAQRGRESTGRKGEHREEGRARRGGERAARRGERAGGEEGRALEGSEARRKNLYKYSTLNLKEMIP